MYNETVRMYTYISSNSTYRFFKKKTEVKMDALEMLGITNGINTLMGNDAQRQQNYSLELMNQQYKYNVDAMHQQEASQLRMFEATGYAARVKQLKEAGLNPALIYGMGAGGGGGVTGNISAPQVSAQSAPNVPASTSNKIAATGMALQLGKIVSEIEANKATAANQQSQADLNARYQPPKLANETDLLGQQVIGQQIKNQFDQINLTVKDETKFADVENIVSLAETAHQKMLQSLNDTTISDATKQLRIQQYNQELLNSIAETSVKWSQKRLNDQEATKLKADVLNIGKQWELKQNDQTINIEQIKNSFNECLLNNMTHMDVAKLNGIMGMIQKLLPSTSIVKPR